MAENNNISCCCGCVGYAYVPIQELNDIYEPCDALFMGTIFPELNLNMCEYGKVCKGDGGIVNG